MHVFTSISVVHISDLTDVLKVYVCACHAFTCILDDLRAHNELTTLLAPSWLDSFDLIFSMKLSF